MYKGVTPTYTFYAPEGLDMTQATKVWVTFATPDEREILTKEGNDLTIEQDNVQVFLEQAETLRMPTGEVTIQLNWLYRENGRTKRATSNKFKIRADTNLKNEVLNVD